MKTTDYIIPTKENPVFTASCDYFGYIESSYKDHLIGNCCSNTFALNFKDAVNNLHEWIQENKEVLENYPKCKFTIYMRDGSIEKNYDQAKEVKVYTISASKAKKLL